MLESDITFTCTAMPRPEIVQQTFESFSNNIEGFNLKKAKLVINVDPCSLPDSRSRVEEVIHIAKSAFDTVEWNAPDEGNFPMALKWVWSRTFTSKYVFHLEDDWLLTAPIHIDYLTSRMIRDVHQVCLRAYSKRRRTKYGYMMSLSPSLLSSKFCNEMASILVPNENPEVHIKRYCKHHPDLGYSNSTVQVFPLSIVLKDIGRDWMSSHGFLRDGSEYFTRWGKA